MLDIKFLRENPDVVKQNIKNKFQDSKLPLVDEVIALDKRNREIKGEVEALRAEKNKISKMIGNLSCTCSCCRYCSYCFCSRHQQQRTGCSR